MVDEESEDFEKFHKELSDNYANQSIQKHSFDFKHKTDHEHYEEFCGKIKKEISGPI